MFNLISEKWIPVVCESGVIKNIAPWEISDENDPPKHLAFKRADFNLAITQFLIGLIQSALPPRDENEWFELLKTPPSPEKLRDELVKFFNCFELYGSSKSFMQYMVTKNDREIDAMILGNPGENTKKENKDFFIKRPNKKYCLCPSCVAAAIYTLQSMAPVGGKGLRQCVRGSSALTTMIEGKTLIDTCLLNIIPNSDTRGVPESIFPWMIDNLADVITPNNRDKSMVYWITPRAIMLNEATTGVCSVCNSEGIVFDSYKEIGMKSEFRQWIHPLCPYEISPKEQKPIQTTDDIIHLNQWMSLLYGTSPTKYVPFSAITKLREYDEDVGDVLGYDDLNIRISGYKNNKALTVGWFDFHQPAFISSNQNQSEAMLQILTEIAIISEIGFQAIDKSVRTMLGPEDPTKRNYAKTPKQIIINYWQSCNKEFNSISQRIPSCDYDSIIQEWIVAVRRTTKKIYDDATDIYSVR